MVQGKDMAADEYESVHHFTFPAKKLIYPYARFNYFFY